MCTRECIGAQTLREKMDHAVTDTSIRTCFGPQHMAEGNGPRSSCHADSGATSNNAALTYQSGFTPFKKHCAL